MSPTRQPRRSPGPRRRADLQPGPRLRPGLQVVRRDERHLQIGLDPPWRLVVPDEPEIHALLDDLTAGRAAAPPESAAAHAVLRDLDRLDMLIRPAPAQLPRVTVTGAPPLVAIARTLLEEAGVPLGDAGEVALVLTDGEPRRAEIDEHMRAGRPHLLLTARPDCYEVGPLVVPGRTACLRCLDAHRAEADPRRPVVVEQLAGAPLAPDDPVLAQLATCWAVRELLAALEGRAAATWSATFTLDGSLRPTHTAWVRHPHCGCSWADELAG